MDKQDEITVTINGVPDLSGEYHADVNSLLARIKELESQVMTVEEAKKVLICLDETWKFTRYINNVVAVSFAGDPHADFLPKELIAIATLMRNGEKG
jgi:hypothetical protein